MKIGVLSDSHHQTTLHAEAIAHLISKGAEYILHAGDVLTREHLELLEQCERPYIVVFGNNDGHLAALSSTYPIYKEPYHFKIRELTVKMMHMPYYMTPDSNIVISGHTHTFETKTINGILFLNPGEVCARDKNLSEHAMIVVADNEWLVHYYFKKPGGHQWQEQNFRTKRV
jgi:putative phosphoesterase